MKKRVLLNVLIVVFAAVFVFSGYNVVKTLYQNAKADKLYDTLQSEYVTPTEPVKQTEQVKEPPITVDFDALCKKNSDVVGWLYLPNTPINYPVVQAEDNDKYLHLGLDGKYLNAGTLLVDCRNGALGEDANYIIYGHHMKNGTMLSAIIQYKNKAFYEENPVIYYFTPQQKYKIELIAGCLIAGNDELYQSSINEKDPVTTANEYQKHSTFKSDVTVTAEDTLVTLSTCSYEYEEARYVVIGKLTKLIEGE